MTRSTPSRTATVLGTAAVLGALAPGSAAAAPVDRTPPALTVAPLAVFVPGTSIGPVQGEVTEDVPMRGSWRATDPSGICGYSSRRVFSGSEPTAWTPWSGARTYTDHVSDYNGDAGGGSLRAIGREVRARDCAGNITSRTYSTGVGVFQETGESTQNWSIPTTYSAAWADSTCVCWSNGTARKSSKTGALARFTFTVDVPSPVGLVMERAADRGKVQVLVDGALKATVDTGSPAKQHRAVVWSGVLPAGTHTLGVRNLGTAGRARVDIDAVLLSFPFRFE